MVRVVLNFNKNILAVHIHIIYTRARYDIIERIRRTSQLSRKKCFTLPSINSTAYYIGMLVLRDRRHRILSHYCSPSVKYYTIYIHYAGTKTARYGMKKKKKMYSSNLITELRNFLRLNIFILFFISTV